MKILIIDDGQINVRDVRAACQTVAWELVSLQPTSHIREKIISQLEELCRKEEPFLALLDYKLWADTTGLHLVDTLKKCQIPFVGFSDYERNKALVAAGAVESIDKNDLLAFKGFDKEKLVKFLEGVIKKLTV